MPKNSKLNMTMAKSGVLLAIGKRMRLSRATRGLTLQQVAKQTGLSASMLSLVERGKAAPSVGTLVAISSVLDLNIPELLGNSPGASEPVTPVSKQSVMKTLEGVVHRVVTDDQTRGLQITLNRYSRGTANSPEPITHEGFEYGLVLEGSLDVTLDGINHSLSAGDLISYRSSVPHRIVNRGRKSARVLWINLRSR